MPHSSHDALTTVCDAVVRLNPQTILDVGPGYGKWGFLFREALDFMGGRHEPSEFAVRIDGLEAYESYSSPLHNWVYDRIEIGDIVEVVEKLPSYDLVMMGDVIEHLSKADGVAVVDALLSKSKNVVVTTPAFFFRQEVLNNKFEEHLSLWQRSDFRRWPYDFAQVGITNIAVLGGVGATWPTTADSRANDIAYSIPGLSRGAIGPRLAKRFTRSVLKHGRRADK